MNTTDKAYDGQNIVTATLYLLQVIFVHGIYYISNYSVFIVKEVIYALGKFTRVTR